MPRTTSRSSPWKGKKHCVLDLGGLPRGAFPVTVRPRESKELFDMPGHGLFLGVFRCRTSRLPVAAQDRTCRLNVMGRGRHFVSQDAVDLSAERQVVELRPASLVRVQVEGRSRMGWSDVVLLCESRLGREQARLRRGLWSNGRWTGVFRYASALFPQGAGARFSVNALLSMSDSQLTKSRNTSLFLRGA